MRERPGTIRITAGEHAARSVLQPGLARLLPDYPDIRVEIVVDYGLVDIVAEGFEKDGREVNVRVDGQLVFNTIRQRLDSALQGLGVAYMPEDVAAPCIASGDLIRVLEDWCPPFPGYHLYYPDRRHASPTFSLLVEALRFKRR
jgi:DNA-binding transcriptional LysR family regulator